MKVLVKLEYRDKVYRSNDIEVSEEGNNQLIDSIERVAQGNLAFKIQNENQTYYFGEKVLQESVITIINVD